MKNIYILLLVVIAACAKDPLQPGAIHTVPDTLSAEERRRETLRRELEAAPAWIAALDPDRMTQRVEAITAADGLHYIRRLLTYAESDTALAAPAQAARTALNVAPELFPRLRARWAELFLSETWLNELAFGIEGQQITFRHGCFAGSGCIVDVHCLIEQELFALHFTGACYTPWQWSAPHTCIGLNPYPDTLN